MEIEKGRAWIAQEAKDVAEVENVPVENIQWVLDPKQGAGSRAEVMLRSD